MTTGGECWDVPIRLTSRWKSDEGRSKLCLLVVIPSLLIGKPIEFHRPNTLERSHDLLENISGH